MTPPVAAAVAVMKVNPAALVAVSPAVVAVAVNPAVVAVAVSPAVAVLMINIEKKDIMG